MIILQGVIVNTAQAVPRTTRVFSGKIFFDAGPADPEGRFQATCKNPAADFLALEDLHRIKDGVVLMCKCEF